MKNDNTNQYFATIFFFYNRLCFYTSLTANIHVYKMLLFSGLGTISSLLFFCLSLYYVLQKTRHPSWLLRGLFTNPLDLGIVTAVIVPGFEEVPCDEHSGTGPATVHVRFTILPVPAANNKAWQTTLDNVAQRFSQASVSSWWTIQDFLFIWENSATNLSLTPQSILFHPPSSKPHCFGSLSVRSRNQRQNRAPRCPSRDGRCHAGKVGFNKQKQYFNYCLMNKKIIRCEFTCASCPHFHWQKLHWPISYKLNESLDERRRRKEGINFFFYHGWITFYIEQGIYFFTELLTASEKIAPSLQAMAAS